MFKKMKKYPVLILFSISLAIMLFGQPISIFISQMNIAEAGDASSFNTPVTVESSGYALHPHAAIDDNGYIYVTYEDWDAGGYIDFIKSIDAGATFGSKVMVENARAWSPRIAVNTFGNAYAFKSTAFTNKLDTNNTGMLEGNAVIIHHDIAVEHVSGIDNICVVVEDNKESSLNLYCAYSINEGKSFSYSGAPTAINASSPARYPAIAAKKSGESHFYAAWVYVGDSIQFDYTTDAGATWQTDTTVSGTGTVENQRPGLAAVKGTSKSWVFAVWSASVGGIKNVYFDYTTSDDYTTWQTDKQIGNSQFWGYDQDQASIAAWLDTRIDTPYPHLYAAWRDTRDNHIYFQEATWDSDNLEFIWGIDADGNGTIEAGEEGNDLRISDFSSGSEENPTVVVNCTGNVYVIWHDRDSSIKCAMYDPAVAISGVPFASNTLTDTPSDGRVDKGTPTVVASADGDVYAIWRDTAASIKHGSHKTVEAFSGTGAPSACAGTAPAAPTELSATAYNGSVLLDWKDNTADTFTSYKAYRGTKRGTYSVITSSSVGAVSIYHDTSAVNGTAYWYVVTAVNSAASAYESGYSNDVRATPNAEDTTAPNAPTSLTATAGNTQISLAWTASTSTDVGSYHIYRSIVSGSTFYYVGYTTSPVISYLNSSLANGMKYYYVVTALDTHNNESADSNEVNATTTESYTPGGGTAPSPAPEPAAGGAGGGCFIATAAFGTPFAREVQILSSFRDKYLLENMPGQLFVKTYYKTSPHVAEFIRNKPLAKKIIRLYLRPAVFAAELLVSDDKVR